MNRAEIIKQISKLTGQSRKNVDRTLRATLHVITNAIYRGERVTLVGFGTFERRSRQAKTGRNPRTLAPLKIPSSRVPAFRAHPEFKDIVDGRMALRPPAILSSVPPLPGEPTTPPVYRKCNKCGLKYLLGTTHRCPKSSSPSANTRRK